MHHRGSAHSRSSNNAWDEITLQNVDVDVVVVVVVVDLGGSQEARRKGGGGG